MKHSSSDPADAPWELLARSLTADITADERVALRDWLQADPSHLRLLTAVTQVWERAGEHAAPPIVFAPDEVKAAWQRLRPLMRAQAPANPNASPVARPPQMTRAQANVRPRWPQRLTRPVRWGIAASLALLLGVGYLISSRHLLRAGEAGVLYASAANRQRIPLPDGSTAWLNAHSRLHYFGAGAGSARQKRLVQLTGEAYFEVKPDPARPFLVNTSTAQVRVTGTAFNVRAYAAEDSMEVSVTHGRVWLVRLATPDSVLLTAGTRATVRATDAPGRVSTELRRGLTADPNFLAWQTDTLRFQDAPVATVVRTLRARFGTTVQFDHPALGQCRFTGTFAHPRPAQVLAVLAAATASSLAADGSGGYVLQGAGCAATPPRPAADTAAAARAPQP